VSEEGEVVALGYKGIAVYPFMAVIKKIGQDLAVTPELGMDVSYVVILVTVKAVVVVIAALVRTEFLIRPAKETGSAVKTYSFHSEMF
jgi:hypothetical protein